VFSEYCIFNFTIMTSVCLLDDVQVSYKFQDFLLQSVMDSCLLSGILYINLNTVCMLLLGMQNCCFMILVYSAAHVVLI
jgi:hypothetical protein